VNNRILTLVFLFFCHIPFVSAGGGSTHGVPASDQGAVNPIVLPSAEEVVSEPDEGGNPRPAQTLQPKIDYQALASSIRQDCVPVQTDQTVPKPKSVISIEPFFIVQGRAKWLPSKPDNPDADIAGVDSDGDCVRDDIEHVIADRFPSGSQHRLRHYLYEYAAWMGQFLRENITEEYGKTVDINKSGARECVNEILGDSAVTSEILSELFADFHNTYPRSYRYLDNLSTVGGWGTRDALETNCS